MAKFISLAFIIFLTTSSLLLPSQSFAHPGHDHELAQTDTPNQADGPERQASDSADTEDDEVTYTLPYPGMLPDHPLYFLKQIRDTIIGVLIADPLKKAEFSLLNADKQIASAKSLAEDDKIDHASDSLDNTKQHFEQVIVSLKKAKEKDKDILPLTTKAETALAKYQEILVGLEQPLDNTQINSLEQDFEEFAQDLDNLK